MIRRSYAKINLALNVLNKNKPSSLHDLDMFNVCISLYDTISIKFIEDNLSNITITCNNPKVPLDDKNLVYRVVEKFKKQFNLSFSAIVNIKKRIPLEAGLGGGSSNAACTLNMLDEHYKTNMSVLQKTKFIEPLTSDGPYFVLSTHCRVKGTGNNIIPIKSSFHKKVLLVKPKSGCSTKDVYTNLDYKNLVHPNINKVEQAIKENDFTLLSRHVDNSLTTSACSCNNEIIELLSRLKTCGFEIVSMSGSGSTCFAMCNNNLAYKRAKQIILKKNYELVGKYKIIN